MTLIRCKGLQHGFGGELILHDVDLQIEKGERCALVGRNGSGKSTLLKILQGDIVPDDGTLWVKADLTVSCLDQSLPKISDKSVYEVVSEGLSDVADLLTRYHQLADDLGRKRDVDELAHLHQRIEMQGGWALNSKIESVLSRLRLNGDLAMSELSGGWLRRVALARALVRNPDLLLLDEPTNHMDIEMIQWLEKQLLDYQGAILFVTHDRALIARVATSIAELDRGHLSVWPGDYKNYLRKRDLRNAVESSSLHVLDRRIRAEQSAMRKGIKARRSRDRGRVKALEKLRSERRQWRGQGVSRLQIDRADRSSRIVKELIDVGHRFDGNELFKGLDLTVLRGDRVAIVGPNGCGKSTLVKIMLGLLEPTWGEVKTGTRVKTAYFDQMRELDPDESVIYNISGGKEFIKINNRSMHVATYLANFLFSRERARAPVRTLSGGESNRLLLARLFSQSANLLVLDEPTNDLDVETLELLEELLAQFKGTVLLITHDRQFIDNVVTSMLVWRDGTWEEHIGGYSDYERRSGHPASAGTTENVGVAKSRKKDFSRGRSVNRSIEKEIIKLSEQIDSIESHIKDIHQRMAETEFYELEQDCQAEIVAELRKLEAELASTFETWERLEAEPEQP